MILYNQMHRMLAWDDNSRYNTCKFFMYILQMSNQTIEIKLILWKKWCQQDDNSFNHICIFFLWINVRPNNAIKIWHFQKMMSIRMEWVDLIILANLFYVDVKLDFIKLQCKSLIVFNALHQNVHVLLTPLAPLH